MPRIVETTVFTIDELSDAAKENARIWYRDQGLHDEWYDFVYEDFETICEIIGVTLTTTPVRLYGGRTREKSRIYHSGFSSQGDGASYEGRWSHVRGSRKAIREHAPKDEELHRIADVLQETAKRNFYQLNATIRHRGRHCHEYCMAIEVERDSLTWQPMTDGAEDTVTETLRDLARWLYRQLEREYEHQTSDAAIDEALAVNEWAFTADGKRFG